MTLIGVLGGHRRDVVTPWGAVRPGDDSPILDWWVAAEDRWYRPEVEASVRQRCVEGVPVIETRLRVPGGDVVQRVTAVPDQGGLTLIDVTNESPLPVAVAFSRPDLLLVRPATEVPTPDIELPEGRIVLPLGHRATLRAALAHHGMATGRLPEATTSIDSVVRGWTTVCEARGRLSVPDTPGVQQWARAGCQAALAFGHVVGDDEVDRDPVNWLLHCYEAVRLGEPADRWLPEVAAGVERLLTAGRRTRLRSRRALHGELSWDRWRALLAAQAVIRQAHDDRASRDIAVVQGHVTAVADPPCERPDGVRSGIWFEDVLARPMPDGVVDLFPGGLPTEWLGAPVEVHGLEVGDGRRLSYALRWHGERPALLWDWTTDELTSKPTALRGGGIDVDWSSSQRSGEALLAAPPQSSAVMNRVSDLNSFS